MSDGLESNCLLHFSLDCDNKLYPKFTHTVCNYFFVYTCMYAGMYNEVCICACVKCSPYEICMHVCMQHIGYVGMHMCMHCDVYI